jgi:hypothetical protein
MSLENSLEDDKYHNEDYIKAVLEDGGEDELQKVREVQGWTEEQTELYRHFSRLWRTVLDNMKIDLQRRAADNPEPTAEEFNLGAYSEAIEPQVREAVLALRRKGYATFYSGFSGFGDEQEIKFASTDGEKIAGQNLADFFAEHGAQLTIEPEAIKFSFTKEAFLPEITELWNKIAAVAPDLGHPALASELASAKIFKEQAKK